MARKNSQPVQPEPEETPKKTPRAKKTANPEPELAPEAATPRRGRAKAALAEPVATTPEQAVAKGARRGSKKVSPEEQPAEAPLPPKRGRKSAPEPVEAVVQSVEEPVSRGRRRASSKPSEAAVPSSPSTTSEPVAKGRSRRRKPESSEPLEGASILSELDAELPAPIVWRSVSRSAASDGGEGDGKVAGRRSKRRRRKDLGDEEITAAAALEPALAARGRRGKVQEGDFDIDLVFRKPKGKEGAVEEPEARRGRRGRGRGRDEEEVGASYRSRSDTPEKEDRGLRTRTRPEPEDVPFRPEPLPPPPPKPIIPIPAEAPQVILREGVPTIVRQGRAYPPIAFFGSASDERRARTVFEEIRLAAENGIHVHVHLVELEVDRNAVASAVAFAGYMLRKTVEVDPDCQVLFRTVFVSPSGWSSKYPNAYYLDESGRPAEPSLCDDEYWGTARDCLQDFVRHLRSLDEGEHILGVHLERGEWFFADGAGYDTSKAAVEKFRTWARMRYLNDFVALRAAWFDSTADFDNLTAPEYHHPGIEGEKFVRSSRKERRWVDYHLFLSDSTVSRIGDLAYAAKEASEGNFLVGVSYGYTFEWSHPSSGHLSLGKLLRTPEIDYIAGPPSYRSREPGGAAPFPCPVDSCALNGKVYISEEDNKTAIGEWKEPDDFNPVIRTPQALESVHWRGAGSALAHATGMNWMDLWGNGWLKTSTIWQRGAQVRDALTLRLGTPLSDPDVAVFIDERALAYLVDQASFALLVQNVRESVLRAGVSAGFYLLSDLTHREKFPESKLYIFLNAWDVRSDLRAAIKNRLQRDDKVLFWLYVAGLFDSGRESLERAREITGVAIKPQPFQSRAGTTILNRKHPLTEAFPDRGIIGGAKLDQTYFAIPEEAIVLGEYTQTGLPSFVVREFGHGPSSERWKSVFMGEPVVTPALVRALGQFAGAHIWNYQDDVVHVRAPFLTVHCSGTGPRTITLPEKWSAYSLISRDWVTQESSSLRFNALDGSTHVFLVGRHADVESLLQTDPADLLKVDEIPAREEDTVRFDAISFDVPIMKLGEWMEGGSLDDVSEDWLLHPKVSDFEKPDEEEPSDEPERVGRRRRKRRGGRGERENGGSTATIRADDEFDLNVMFRKRE